MDKIEIEGGTVLSGKVKVSGAKNAALPIMTAAILAPGEHNIYNVPDLRDIATMGKLMAHLGMGYHQEDGEVIFNSDNITSIEAPYDFVKTMRASILVLGPLLARTGEAKVSLPGGCAIGARPVNLHVMGLEKMGAKITLDEGYIHAKAKKLKGAKIYFDIPTVTGTENLMMAAAIAAGARIINDVSALQGDQQSLDVVASSKACVVLMHMRGDPQNMQNAPVYDDVVGDVLSYLSGRIAACVRAGIAKERIAIDPGIGFGKTLQHNLHLLRNLDAFRELGCPLVLGVSRKSFIGQLSGEDVPARRLAGSLAAALAGVDRGAAILRVHDVAQTRQALDVWQGIKNPALS